MIQSIVLKKNKYSLDEAEKKVLELGHKIKYNGKKVNEYKAGETLNYWRFRQMSPIRFLKNSFYTKRLNDDIYLILGDLK